jgi:hypothetical protein
MENMTFEEAIEIFKVEKGVVFCEISNENDSENMRNFLQAMEVTFTWMKEYIEMMEVSKDDDVPNEYSDICEYLESM